MGPNLENWKPQQYEPTVHSSVCLSEAGSHGAQTGFRLAIAEDDLAWVFCLYLPSHSYFFLRTSTHSGHGLRGLGSKQKAEAGELGKSGNFGRVQGKGKGKSRSRNEWGMENSDPGTLSQLPLKSAVHWKLSETEGWDNKHWVGEQCLGPSHVLKETKLILRNNSQREAEVRRIKWGLS